MDMTTSPFGGNTQGSGDGPDFQHYLRLLLHNKWKLAAFVFIVTAIVFVIVKPMKSIYQAESTVLIDSNRKNLVELQDVYGSGAKGREYFATQYEIIQSRELISRVVDRVGLTTHVEYDPRQAPESGSVFSLGDLMDFFSVSKSEDEDVLTEEEEEAEIRRKIIDGFSDSLVVEPVVGTLLVKISYESTDPELSALVANAVADVYIESYLEARLTVAKKATTWLGDRLSELRENLQKSEEALQQYRERESLVDVKGVRTLDSAELTQLRSDLLTVRQERLQAQTIYEQVKGYQGFSSEKLLSIPVILSNNIVQSLVRDKGEVDRRVVELSSRYGEQHPAMLAALAQQRELQNDLDARLQTVAQGIYANYQSALNAERSISSQINQTRGRLQNVSRKEVRLRELEREVETNRQLYDLFLSRGKESDESSKLEDPPARIIDEAVVPIEPVGPPKLQFVLAAIVLSSSLAVGLIVLLDLLDSTVRTSDDVEHKLRASMLGFLPMEKSNKSEFAFRAFVNADDRGGGFSEAVRTIRTSLVLSSLDKPFKTIVVTSSIPSEGKSTVSLNIADALGQMEKVLLIDADMRRPTMAKAMGLPQSSMGLSDIIVGKAEVDDCLHRIPDSEIDVIVSGTIPNNPLELISSKQFKEMLAGVQEKYDRIVIDSAPVHLVSDAQVLSSYADSLIYIVKSNSTPVSIASKGIKTLRSINAPLTGVVLNQVDLDKAGQYDSYYGVYKEYSYANDAKT